MAKKPDPSKSNPGRLLAILGGATAAILCACILVIVWVLNVSSTSLDRSQEQGERRLVTSVIDSFAKNLSKSVADYAGWDELYAYLLGERQADWDVENLGPYVSTAFGVDKILVTLSDGTVVYHYSRVKTALSTADRKVLARLARQAVRIASGDRAKPVSGVVGFGGVPSVVAAAALPLPPQRTALPSQRFVLIEFQEIRGGFLASVERDFGLRQLKVTRTHSAKTALKTPDRTPSGYDLAWEPSHAGQALFDSTLPIVTSIGLASLLAVLGLLFAWSRVADQMRHSEARVARAEVEASDARARAAEETSRSKSAFIANMSHELRTPLNAIIGFSELMETEVFGPLGASRYREYLRDIITSGHHLLGLVNDILQVSKIEAGKFEPVLEPISLSDVVEESLRMVDVLASKRNIRVTTTFDAEPRIVVADKQAVQQVLINVLANAIKFSADGQEVEVACSSDETCHTLSVTDRGCGIPAHVLHELGKPFVQAEGTYSRNYQGTGLGLAISFMLARSMNATIDISSVEGSGTTVRLSIPRHLVSEASPEVEQAA